MFIFIVLWIHIVRITETDGRILPIHWLRKNTAKYSKKRI